MQHNYSQETTQGKPNKQMHRKTTNQANKKMHICNTIIHRKKQGKIQPNKQKNVQKKQPTK